MAQKKTSGPGQYLHDWFNAKAASALVEGSQLRVSRPKVTMEGTASTEIPDGERHDEAEEFDEDMEALRDLEDRRDETIGGQPTLEDDGDAVMEIFATQGEAVPANRNREPAAEDEDDVLQEVTVAPPVFRPVTFGSNTDLSSRVSRRIREGHEVVLEEQPKWALLARVLKEIEDTIARVADTHAGG